MIIIKNENETLGEAIDRAFKEKELKDIERQKPKELTDCIGYWDLAIVFNDEEIKQMFLLEGEMYTFKELLDWVSDNKGVKYLILENCLKGEIWQYGNYHNENRVIYHGTTNGYGEGEE